MVSTKTVFLRCFGKRQQGTPRKMQGFSSLPNPQILLKESKNAQKARNVTKQKKARKGKKQETPSTKQGFSIPTETGKSLQKKGKCSKEKQEIPHKRNTKTRKEILPKNQGRTGLKILPPPFPGYTLPASVLTPPHPPRIPPFPPTPNRKQTAI